MSRQRLLRGICGLLSQQQHVRTCDKGHQLASAVAAAGWGVHQPAPSVLRAAAAALGQHRAIATSGARLDSLSGLLSEEIKFETDNYKRPEQVSGGPPAPFKLAEAPGDTLLSLSRPYKGEEVNVDLHVNNQPSPPYEGEEGDEVSTVVFNVSVVKDDKALVFECESDGNSVTINHVSLEPKDGFDSESMYTGPVFGELDENLQRQFTAYLEERGITAELGEYLRFLIYDKEQREYQGWLSAVEKFTAK